jgi:signal transduction histidine kinase
MELRTAFAAELPDVVIGDSLRVQQVLTNLLSNAVKFTNCGMVTVEAAVVASHDKQATVRFTITDTGIGIKADALERIFESFVQADDSSTRLYGGTGLGLAISKQLVELMGGEIGVTSEFGKGSCFWFAIPLRRTSASEDPAVASLAGRTP